MTGETRDTNPYASPIASEVSKSKPWWRFIPATVSLIIGLLMLAYGGVLVVMLARAFEYMGDIGAVDILTIIGVLLVVFASGFLWLFSSYFWLKHRIRTGCYLCLGAFGLPASLIVLGFYLSGK